MRINTQDQTLKKNYLQKYQFLVQEYELVKAKQHPLYWRVEDFYQAHGTCRQTFLKYYSRYKATGDASSFMPQKRGPKYRTRRTPAAIEAQVLAWRAKGCNKFEINDILKPQLANKTPCPSTIYNIMKRHGVHKKTRAMQEEKRRIIKEKSGN